MNPLISKSLNSKPVVEAIYNQLRLDIKQLIEKTGRPPCLVTILVGADPASALYVRKKGETCKLLGMEHRDFKLPENTTEDELIAIIKEQNCDPGVDGILIQKPLPKHINEPIVFDLISPAKDVDCFSAENVGLLNQGRPRTTPCTPAGVMALLAHFKINPSGMNALIVGRSDIVGKPLTALLLAANATVTVAHSKTKNLAEHVALADIVIAAVGKPRFLKAGLPWKKSCVVIDVGINRTGTGIGSTICGDVDYENVKDLISAITPVPGGVGPMTIAMLMANTVRTASLYYRHG